MNIRIEEQNLRFKISEDELFLLLDRRSIHERVQIMDKTLVVTISPDKDNEGIEPKFVINEFEASLNLYVSPEKLKELSNISPSKNGLCQEIGGLSLTLQVDMPKACHL